MSTITDTVRLLTADEAEIADELDQLPFRDAQTVRTYRYAFDQAQIRRDQRNQLDAMLNPPTRLAGLGPVPVRVADVTVFAVAGSGAVTEAVFSAVDPRTGQTLWRVVTGGRLSSRLTDSQATALLLWLEMTHNNGRSDNAATFAARVLGVPESR